MPPDHVLLDSTSSAAPTPRDDQELRRRGRVLIIDDNPAVLKGQQRALSKHHDVTAESDPRVALGRFESGERFDVVFCDLMMPHLAGPDLYDRVLEIDAEQARRFVFITGGVLQPGAEEFLATTGNLHLDKPVRLRVFREVIERFAAKS